MNRFRTYSSAETSRLGRQLAQTVRPAAKKARIIFLSGELGAGKTTFSQGFLRGLGVRSRITSPTFVLSKRYDLKKNKFKSAYHLDCYRLQSKHDLEHIGFNQIKNDRNNLILAEWPEKIWRRRPPGSIRVNLKHGRDGNERNITIQK